MRVPEKEVAVLAAAEIYSALTPLYLFNFFALFYFLTSQFQQIILCYTTIFLPPFCSFSFTHTHTLTHIQSSTQNVVMYKFVYQPTTHKKMLEQKLTIHRLGNINCKKEEAQIDKYLVCTNTIFYVRERERGWGLVYSLLASGEREREGKHK